MRETLEDQDLPCKFYGVFVHLRLELWCKLQWKDCDREVANAAGRALAGVVVAAHGAANLEDSFGERGFFGRKTART